MPTAELRCVRVEDETCLHHLHVFPAEDRRPVGHCVLCAAEKDEPNHIPTHIPPRGNGVWHVHLLQVPDWQSRHNAGPDQLLGARGHVHLLLPDRLQAGAEEIVLVEEAHNADPTGE